MKFYKLSRLRWAGHVIRQDDDDDDLSRRVLLSEPGGKCPRGRSRLRWEDGVEEDVARLGCRNWKVVALNREGWRKLLTLRRLMSYIYGAPILDVSRSHTTTQHSR